jgi:hypothetical protein
MKLTKIKIYFHQNVCSTTKKNIKHKNKFSFNSKLLRGAKKDIKSTINEPNVCIKCLVS